MNRAKWNNSRIPITVLAAKLAEEAGEVAGAIADAEEYRIMRNTSWQGATTKQSLAIREEISHARFLLDLIEERLG